MGPTGALREVVILKALSFERKLDFLNTILIARAVTLDNTKQDEVQSYNDLVKQYEDAFYYKSPKIAATKKKITPEMLERLIGKKDKNRKKGKKITFSTGKPVDRNLTGIDISELSKTLMK